MIIIIIVSDEKAVGVEAVQITRPLVCCICFCIIICHIVLINPFRPNSGHSET